jgi:dihydroorotate dehydrogenase electron transfer subunit
VNRQANTQEAGRVEAEAKERGHVVEARVLAHREYAAGYRLLVFDVPEIADAVSPGQFVHLLVPSLEASVLRRPFSIFRADANSISILYKPVGHGTRVLTSAPEGSTVSLIGPLGRGFPPCPAGSVPVLVAGGYGVAPLYLLASRTDVTGALFVGGRTSADILCRAEFEELGWDVHVATEDGSVGTKGLVTDALDSWLSGAPDDRPCQVYACGPDGMLRAVGERAVAAGIQAWLSLDKHMGCGVGACLACVQKVRGKDGREVWTRVCKDGPVFDAREVVWE